MVKTLATWSVDDYHRMIDAGILADRSVELLAGEIVTMSPETPLHYVTGKRVSHYLSQRLANQADVRFNGPITLSDSEPEPDVAIVRLPESRYEHRHPGPADIFWVMEIAKSSLQKDLTLKARLYAAAQLPEYWLIDLGNRTIHVFRHPQGDHYQHHETLQTGVIYPITFPDLAIAVDTLLGDISRAEQNTLP